MLDRTSIPALRAALLLGSLLIGTATPVHAETIVVLKNGAKIVVEELRYEGDEAILRLSGGEIRVDRSRIDREIDNAASLPSAVADPAKVETTHAAVLQNGRTIRGNLIEESDSEIVLGIPSVGQVTFARAEIAELRAERGLIDVSVDESPQPSPAAEVVEVVEVAPEIEADAISIEDVPVSALVDLLLELDGDRIEDLPKSERRSVIEELDQRCYDITRHRTIFRTRAEAKLRSYGALAIPRLEALREHPFDLVRRAVQRLVRDAGSLAGTPIAIDRLADKDFWTRTLAHEAIEKTLGLDVDVSPKVEPPSRRIQRETDRAWTAWYAAVAKRLESKGVKLEDHFERAPADSAVGAK